MGSLNYRRDVKWDKQVVKLPGSEKWGVLDKHIVNNGFCVDLCGQQMLFLDVSNHWISLVSKTAALRISQIVGNDNVSVNYITSYEPYYSKLSKSSSANSASFVPVSTCIGTERLSMEIDVPNRLLTFDPVRPFPLSKKGSRVPDFVYGLCYQPADHINLPDSYIFPGVGRILNFLRPLFPDVRSMVTYMWVIGNASRDPVARPRCLMLCGHGGSGKSTAIRMATAALSGCVGLLPDNILTKTYEGVEDKVAQIIVRSRMVTCYELDLDNKRVNMSTFKNVTGGDIVKVGEFSSKAVCSMMIATNGLPDVVRDPEFMSDALSRRMVCVKMDVDTAEAPFEPDPSDPVDKVDFLCSCLYVRMKYDHIPISPDNLLLTLCGSMYFKALVLVTEAPVGTVTVLQGREVLAVLSGLLNTTPIRLTDRCRLISMSCVENTPMGFIIRGLKPTGIRSFS
jgi:hypothetical protein